MQGTIATSGGKTMQLRKLVNGPLGRYLCRLQYLFWLLASKMTSGSLRPRSPYLADVRLWRVKSSNANWTLVEELLVEDTINYAILKDGKST